ncbi:MAG: GntR family transcriptional regulator [Parasporobacterium sp.]|nr:GntR family transcriptional regulator [Parasporobacterium sp.]
MANLKLSFDEYIPLRDIVFKTLREAIVTGELKPGERLMEIKLANEMGVSRTPVREAIRKLEQEGLVYLTARKGAEVAPINAKDLKEVLEIRKALEGLACQMACQNAKEEDIRTLQSINEEIGKAIELGDIEQIARLDAKFHDQICICSSNSQLIRILSRLKEHIYRYRLEYIADIKNKNTIIEDHERIIQDIVKKNEKAVKKDIEHHIEIQEKYILNSLGA